MAALAVPRAAAALGVPELAVPRAMAAVAVPPPAAALGVAPLATPQRGGLA